MDEWTEDELYELGDESLAGICDFCGFYACECDRLAIDQNDDYESLVY